MTPIDWLTVHYGVSPADLEAALAVEREAIAQYVEVWPVPQDCDMTDMKLLADAIRARSTP